MQSTQTFWRFIRSQRKDQFTFQSLSTKKECFKGSRGPAKITGRNVKYKLKYELYSDAQTENMLVYFDSINSNWVSFPFFLLTALSLSFIPSPPIPNVMQYDSKTYCLILESYCFLVVVVWHTNQVLTLRLILMLQICGHSNALKSIIISVYICKYPMK